MKKTFCDRCDNEITKKNSPRNMTPGVKVGNQTVDLGFFFPNVSDVDLCKYCIIDGFSAADDRPRPA